MGRVRPVPTRVVEREALRRSRLLDSVWPHPAVDTAPVERRPDPAGRALSPRRQSLLDLADGVRTPAAIARELGRPAFNTLVEVRRLAAAGLIGTPDGSGTPAPTGPAAPAAPQPLPRPPSRRPSWTPPCSAGSATHWRQPCEAAHRPPGPLTPVMRRAMRLRAERRALMTAEADVLAELKRLRVHVPQLTGALAASSTVLCWRRTPRRRRASPR